MPEASSRVAALYTRIDIGLPTTQALEREDVAPTPVPRRARPKAAQRTAPCSLQALEFACSTPRIALQVTTTHAAAASNAVFWDRAVAAGYDAVDHNR